MPLTWVFVDNFVDNYKWISYPFRLSLLYMKKHPQRVPKIRGKRIFDYPREL